MTTNPFFPQLGEIAALKATILKQPEALHAARLALADKKRALKAASDALKDAEMEIACLVNADKTFTNAEARKAEIAKRSAANPEIKRLAATVDACDVEVTNTQIDVQKIEDEVKTWRTHADITCAEIQLLCIGR